MPGCSPRIRAAATSLDPARHVIIYLANPTIGVRGMLTHIVAALGHTPVFHTARLAPQAADALAAEHAERGRNPVLVVDEAHPPSDLLGGPDLETGPRLDGPDVAARVAQVVERPGVEPCGGAGQRLDPRLAPVAQPVAILLGGIGASGGLLQRRLGLPDASILVLQGIIFICVLASETLYGRFTLINRLKA